MDLQLDNRPSARLPLDSGGRPGTGSGNDRTHTAAATGPHRYPRDEQDDPRKGETIAARQSGEANFYRGATQADRQMD